MLGSCAANYTGPMCSQCIEGFSRDSQFVCSKCPPLGLNISILVLLGLGIVGLMALLIWATLKSQMKAKSEFSIYFRLVAGHAQLLMLLASFRFEWPPEV